MYHQYYPLAVGLAGLFGISYIFVDIAFEILDFFFQYANIVLKLN